MKKLSLFILMSILAIFSGCKKDNASTDSGNGGGGGNETIYNIGDYYDVNGVNGVVYKISDEGRHGMIVSMDEPYGFRKWSKENVVTGSTSFNDGKSNMDLIISNFDLEQYPAFEWCNSKNVGDVTGWYLPSFYELGDIVNAKNIINETLTENGGAEFLDAVYWSSSEDTFARASSYPGNGYSKGEYHKVRAVHSF
ncbi:MAG: hypothetical protein J5686_01970 [Bacteroidales bacterium]|nr:hypothetical protein [Bacteroidales bacterium]